MRWSLTSASRASAITRLVCSPVLLIPSAVVAAAFLGQGVVLGLAWAVVPAYLAWVWSSDALTLLRSRGAPACRARPAYGVFALLSALVLPAYWLWMWWSEPTWSFPRW